MTTKPPVFTSPPAKYAAPIAPVAPPVRGGSPAAYQNITPASAVKTDTKNHIFGGQTLTHRDASGAVVGKTVISRNGTILSHTVTEKDGSNTEVNHKTGVITNTLTAGTVTTVTRHNTLTGDQHIRSVDKATGLETVQVSRNNTNFQYNTAPRQVGNTTTVIHEYQPTSTYGGSDFWFYLWMFQSMNQNHSTQMTNYGGGNAGSGSAAGAPSVARPNAPPPPTSIAFDWSGIFKNLPPELGLKKSYKDGAGLFLVEI